MTKWYEQQKAYADAFNDFLDQQNATPEQRREAYARMFKIGLKNDTDRVINAVKENPGKLLTAFIAGAITF
jgi:hypothetical protein